MSSILTDTKKLLGIAEDYTAFDADVILSTNSALAELTQIGVGPETGFSIASKTETWEDFIGDDPRLSMVQQTVYMMVRLSFDPPSTSYHTAAMKEQVTRLVWRLNAEVDV